MAERHAFDTAVASLYETVLDPQHWDAAIVDVARYFAAPQVTKFSYDFAANQAYDFRSHGLDAGASERYSSYYCTLDPGRAMAMVSPVSEWVADEALLDLRAPHDQEYVQDFALRNGIGRVGGFKICGDASTCTWLSMMRRPGDERFGDAARRQYEALKPHMQRVSRMQSRLDALAVGNTLARACLDRLHASVLVVDRARHVHLANAHATQLLGERRELLMSNRQLKCGVPSLDERLGRLIVAACVQPASGGAMCVARDADRTALLLSVLPIPQRHELAALLPEPLALIVIGDPSADRVPIEIYRTLFSLTAAEALLMAALVRGSTVSDWARQRSVSVATARTQLHSLFEKTGVDSQARIVGLAKSILPVS